METLTQACSQCGHEYPFTNEFFRGVRFGLSARCKPCAREATAKSNEQRGRSFTQQAKLKKEQEAATKAMIKGLGDLSHVPERLRPLYQQYRTMLVLREYHATEYRVNV